jgi:hypothetical protein
MTLWKQIFALSLLLTTSGVVLAEEECTPCYSGEEAFLLEPLRPGEEGYNCTSAVERAATAVNGKSLMKTIQCTFA